MNFHIEEDDPYKPAFVDEVSYMKFWFHEVTLNYNSNMRHRLDKVLHHASNHNYEPYAKKREGTTINYVYYKVNNLSVKQV